MTAAEPSDAEARPGPAARALSVLAEVRPAEVVTVVLLTLAVFVLLLAYYLLKPVREALILGEQGAEVKSYASAGQALLLLPVVAAYGALARRSGRMTLITTTVLFFASNLLVFFLLGRGGALVGVPFYLWVGCFNVTVVAQFWSFANDVYTPEQGKRLFAVVGGGSSVGAVLGAKAAEDLFRRLSHDPLGPYYLMLAAAALLLVYLLLVGLVHGREAAARPAERAGERIGAQGAFRVVLQDRYLLLIAALVLLLNWVNSTGEYLLDRLLSAWADAEVLASGGAITRKAVLGAFKADFYFWVNTSGVILQLFVVSRIFKYLGVRAALLILPLIALGGYATLAFVPLLALVRFAKIAENSVDYSVQNTARHALFLPTSREAKYSGKAVIDTFVQRAGDVLSAVLVAVGSLAGLGTTGFALANLVLVVVWIAVVVALGREHRARAEEARPEAPAAPAAV